MVYMSPEQMMGEAPSPLDDIYSLGATIYAGRDLEAAILFGGHRRAGFLEGAGEHDGTAAGTRHRPAKQIPKAHGKRPSQSAFPG